MYQLTAVYSHPSDPEAFVSHYRDQHAKIASQLPNVLFYDWHVCETLDGATPPYFLAAVRQWESEYVTFLEATSKPSFTIEEGR